MKIILSADVDKLGRKGEIVEVADGYARNYLVPSGKALLANRNAQRQADQMRRAGQAAERKAREAADQVARALQSGRLVIGARAGEGGKLFGSVTAADLVKAAKTSFGVDLDRRRIDLSDPIRELGLHQIPVDLHPEVAVELIVEVVPA